MFWHKAPVTCVQFIPNFNFLGRYRNIINLLFYNKFIIFLYMFRALLCSSSGGQNCIIQHLVSSRSVGGRPVRTCDTNTQSVELLWTRDRAAAETSTWQYTTLTRHKHWSPWRDSNPQSQQSNGRRPTPYTTRSPWTTWLIIAIYNNGA